ncbi:hypothetical protein HETIRDRAFT_99901 [Heterobasidion irregulare TC 32-1]|uniref:Uncharacterized protein n=1 Tax=Heterobasidion irregulare (strain TC 32-1) TaxID=747525 RepID=W4KPD9_HETIT|nr:uncharacterized protein HETIRDRAFT_99901 [Heterobasidion irregulare TC 32-1]ETW87569.1 hypothetical protein HETIRDRAFT_99901 [Heterobasidion irregulare TC 32-1]
MRDSIAIIPTAEDSSQPPDLSYRRMDCRLVAVHSPTQSEGHHGLREPQAGLADLYAMTDCTHNSAQQPPLDVVVQSFAAADPHRKFPEQPATGKSTILRAPILRASWLIYLRTDGRSVIRAFAVVREGGRNTAPSRLCFGAGFRLADAANRQFYVTAVI